MESPSKGRDRLQNYYIEVQSLRRKLGRTDLPEEKRKNAQERLDQLENRLIPVLAAEVS